MNIKIWLPMLLVARPGQPITVHSPRNWLSTRRQAVETLRKFSFVGTWACGHNVVRHENQQLALADNRDGDL